MWVYWLVAAGLLFVGEILTPSFILLWFAIGALAGSLAAFLNLHLYVQIAVFIIASTLLLIFTRPILKKTLKANDTPSNVYALTGKRGIVIQEIKNVLGQGQVKIGGEIWMAQSEDSRDIQVGAEVEILRVEGVRLIVNQVVKSKIKEGVVN